MSVTFSIKNKKNSHILSPKELLDLQGDSFTQFNLEEGDQNYPQIMHNPINEYGYMLMGQEKISGRGFEVSYDVENEDYNIRVFTPSTKNDWIGALEFIKNLAVEMNSQVVSEQGNIYSADNIDYPYLEDIQFGIRTYEDKENYIIFGVHRPICFSKEMINNISNANDKVDFFSKLVEESQHLDAYIAKQMFYEKDNLIKGVYTITQTVDTVLPHKYPPFINFLEISLKAEDVHQWVISFVIIDGDENNPNSYKRIGELDYKTFLERLSEDKYRKLDGEYMLVKLSTKKEMEEILNGENNTMTQQKSGLFSKIKGWFK